MNDEAEPVWSVTEVNQAVRDMLETGLMPFWIGGEIGTLNLYASGHAYMTLKDERCQIKAVYFGGVAAMRKMRLQVGDRIEAFGKLSVYDVRGEYQFAIKNLRAVGVGDLQRRFELLKQKLADEGLFDAGRKKPIPAFPRGIGVVTSPDGAAVRDFLRLLDERFGRIHVKIFPSAVQGAEAAGMLADGVEFFNRPESGVDVIVLTRGGGSMEDLWPFNEEILARAIAASQIPVISAVGHEIDFTIADFVADMRVPTPSAAAELVAGQYALLLDRIDLAERHLRDAARQRTQVWRHRLEMAAASYVFREPAHLLRNYQQRVDELDGALQQSLRRLERERAAKVDILEARLRALNPFAVLERGYSILLDRDSGRAVTRSGETAPGQMLRARLAEGEITVQVQE